MSSSSARLLQRSPLAAALEALLPCPGRREIYLREIVCEYVACWTPQREKVTDNIWGALDIDI